MRPVGFSTGALALSDYRKGVDLLRERQVPLVELSALREEEVIPLMNALDSLDLSGFRYVSFHAPSAFKKDNEANIILALEQVARRNWPIIIHPDAIWDFSEWERLGSHLLVENMDKRKGRGRTAAELREAFDRLPKAGFCFDIGHARQVDPTMSEAARILKEHGQKLSQIHISDVNTQNRHDPLTFGAMNAFRQIAYLIPPEVPAILESRLEDPLEIEREISRAQKALAPLDAQPRQPAAQVYIARPGL